MQRVRGPVSQGGTGWLVLGPNGVPGHQSFAGDTIPTRANLFRLRRPARSGKWKGREKTSLTGGLWLPEFSERFEDWAKKSVTVLRKQHLKIVAGVNQTAQPAT